MAGAGSHSLVKVSLFCKQPEYLFPGLPPETVVQCFRFGLRHKLVPLLGSIIIVVW